MMTVRGQQLSLVRFCDADSYVQTRWWSGAGKGVNDKVEGRGRAKASHPVLSLYMWKQVFINHKEI